MNGGWEVGDLALCVNAAPRAGKLWITSYRPELNAVYTVVAVGSIGLKVAEIPDDATTTGWLGFDRFRKIKPDTEPCEEEFTVLIKRMKPAKVKA